MGLKLDRFSLSRLCFFSLKQFLNSSGKITVDREILMIVVIVGRRVILHFLSSVVEIGSRSQDVSGLG